MNYHHFIRKYAKLLYTRFTGNRGDLLNRRPDYIRQDYDDLVELIVQSTPNKCPIWQCGAMMRFVERPPPKDFTSDDEYTGDWQTPDQVCTNCGAVYEFKDFKGRNRAKKAVFKVS